jgi:uncharacterized protein (TIGR02118 family)
MYILTVSYPKSADSTFDFDYFRSKHLPEVGEAYKPFGLGYAAVLRGEESLGGGDPHYYAISVLSFATEKGARDAVASKAGKALDKDVANFTNVIPLMQFNTSVS